MKPSRPKEERVQDQINRGLAASRLITDDLVLAWFSSERDRLVEQMIKAPVGDDAGRRDAAIKLQALHELKTHLSAEASLGRNEQEKAKTHG